MEWDAVMILFADGNDGGVLGGAVRGGIIGGIVGGLAAAVFGLVKAVGKKKPPTEGGPPRARRVR